MFGKIVLVTRTGWECPLRVHAVDMNSMDVGRMLGLLPRSLPEPTLAGAQADRPNARVSGYQRRVAPCPGTLARLPHAAFLPSHRVRQTGPSTQSKYYVVQVLRSIT